MKNIKAWKTTSLGLIVLTAAVVSVFAKGASWMDASVGIAIGVALLFSPDTILSSLTKLFRASVIILLVSCNPVKQVLKKPNLFQQVADSVVARGYCVNDTVINTLVQDTTVYRDSIVKDSFTVPCPDFQTQNSDGTLVKIRGGKLHVEKPVRIPQRQITQLKQHYIRDTRMEDLLSRRLQARETLINQLTIDNQGLRLKLAKWQLFFFLLVLVIIGWCCRKKLCNAITGIL